MLPPGGLLGVCRLHCCTHTAPCRLRPAFDMRIHCMSQCGTGMAWFCVKNSNCPCLGSNF